MTGLARCVLCRREVEFADNSPKRCTVREGGCGASGAMKVLRAPSKALATPEYAPRPTLPELARQLDEALAREVTA